MAVWPKKRGVFLLLSLVTAGALLAHAGTGWAEEKDGAQEATFLAGVRSFMDDHVSFQGRALLYGFSQRPLSGNQNPGNRFLNISRAGAVAALRPEASFQSPYVEGLVRPRWEFRYQYWDEGDQKGEDDWDEEAFVNEWFLRLKPHSFLAMSYGRENIQWGPAYFLSPTNPFFRDNGRSNPKQEVAGMDFFRAVWSPVMWGSVSFMANTGKGRQEFLRGFEKTYALKADYTGHRWYASGVVSWQDQGSPTWGGYAGATLTEAFMLYGEASVRKGTTAFYPAQSSDSPIGLDMRRVKEDEETLYPLLLMGMSYTTLWGPTGVMEYVYNGAGYDGKEAGRYFTLIDRAGGTFGGPEPYESLGKLALWKTLDPQLRLLRRHYLMLQYQQADIGGRLDVVVRYTVNLDDGSSRVNPILDFQLTDRWSAFLVGSQSLGSDALGLWSSSHPNRAEFRRIGDYSVWVGAECVF